MLHAQSRPAQQDDSSEGDTMTRKDRPEKQQYFHTRSDMVHRLLQLRDAGLPTESPLAMFRNADCLWRDVPCANMRHSPTGTQRPGSYHHSNHMCPLARRRHHGNNPPTHFHPHTTWRDGQVECHHHSTSRVNSLKDCHSEQAPPMDKTDHPSTGRTAPRAGLGAGKYSGLRR